MTLGTPDTLPIFSAIGQNFIKNHLASDQSADETLIKYRLATEAAKQNFHLNNCHSGRSVDAKRICLHKRVDGRNKAFRLVVLQEGFLNTN